jgi:hypothetical protein
VFQIGNSLREARLRHGMDFPQLEQATKIRGKYLRALEEEQFELLPSQTYVKGFLRSYAESLGLDGQLYVDEYNSRYVTGEEESPIRTRRPVQRQRRRGVESRAVVLALLGIVALTAFVIVAWKFGGGSSNSPLPTVLTGASGKATLPQQPKAPLLSVLALRGTSMLVVRQGSASGRLLYQGTVEKGQPAQRFGGKRLWITLARPEALRVIVNGRTVKLRRGKPVVALVTRNGIRPTSA